MYTVLANVSVLGDEPLEGLADRVAGARRGQDRLGLQRGQVLLALSRNQFRQQPVQPVDALHLRLRQLVAAVDQHPQHLQVRVMGEHPQALGADRDDRHRVRVMGVGLAVMPSVQQPRPSRQLRRHVHNVLTVGQQPLRQRPTGAVAALHRPHPFPVPGDVPAHRGVAGLVGAEPAGR